MVVVASMVLINLKLKMMAVQFVHQIIYHCPEQRLSPIGAVILSALTRLVNEEKENQKLRGSCYVAIGKLGLKLPSLVNKDVSMIQTFFGHDLDMFGTHLGMRLYIVWQLLVLNVFLRLPNGFICVFCGC